MQNIEEQLKRLRTAGTALYFAGKWSCHRPVDEVRLWEALRGCARP